MSMEVSVSSATRASRVSKKTRVPSADVSMSVAGNVAPACGPVETSVVVPADHS